MASAGPFLDGVNAESTALQNQQLANIDIQKGGIDVQEQQMKLDHSKKIVAAQNEMLTKMKSLHPGAPGQAGPGGQAQSPEAALAVQANELANYHFQLADAYSSQGLPEEGVKAAEEGLKMAENSARLQTGAAERQLAMWGHVERVIDGVKTPADWDKARMIFPQMFPEEAKNPAVQKFLQMPYDPKTVDILKRSAQSAKEQADLEKVRAETLKDNAHAKTESATQAKEYAEAQWNKARAAAVGKAGGKPPAGAEISAAKSRIAQAYPDADPKAYSDAALDMAERAKRYMAADMSRDEAYDKAFNEVDAAGRLKNLPSAKDSRKQAEATDGVLDDIANLKSLLEENRGMQLSGVKGRIKGVGETLRTATGLGNQDAPENRYVAVLDAMRSRLPQVLAKKGRLAKDERAIIDEVANLRAAGVTDEIAWERLDALEKRLKGQKVEGDETIEGKGDKTGAPSFKSEAEIGAALKSGKINFGDTVTLNGQEMEVKRK